MAKTLSTIQEIQNELDSLSENKSLAQAQRVILSVIRLLDDSVSLDNNKMFELFNVDNQKISANANWFYEDSVMVDRRATYKIHAQNSLNIDFKLYGLTKPSKRTISWIQALIPNFEDEPFNSKYSIGIDFVVPKSSDKVIIVLSNSYVIRTLELKGTLTATFQEILSKWANISDFSNKKEVHAILWESFDLQPLNKKFYAGISERFISLRQHLTKADVLDDKHASLFANRLLGRVIFCWFLDKKGIINADKKYFDSESFESDNEYYKTKLENLFFGVLNTPIPDREYKDEVTPFLNGGLFEARDTDLYKSSKLTFPKNYFDDLFGFLSAYNFTTDESTSQFQQVAIDPEMLGRIFENLLAEMTEEDGGQARKAKGAFYTPREIVDYMCRESLKEYLKTKLPEDEHRDQRLEQLIDRPDKEFQDQDHNWRRDWKPYKDSIIDALDELKVLDPACGSGAFPIGMLQLLVRVYERLEARFDPYKTKLQIIEKNIYGVDIEPMAVEIARLRTWLSIIVDEEADSKKIKPLPNLEFKFVCANSLIDLDKSGQVTLYGDDPELENKLRDIRDAYFNTESLNKKRKLKADYEKIVNVGEGLFGASEKSKQLKTYRPFDNETTASFFNSEFMFGNEKFNIVIGNPPYGVKFSSEEKKLMRGLYSEIQFKIDSYALFTYRSIDLLNKEGICFYIIPSTLLDNFFLSNLRKKLVVENQLLELVELDDKVFSSAVVHSLILGFKKTNAENYNIKTGKSKALEGMTTIVPKSYLLNQENFQFNLRNYEYDSLIKKLEIDSIKFEKIIDLRQAIKTGNDELYITDQKLEGYKPIIRGKDMGRYFINFKNLYLNYGKHLACPRDEKIFNQPKLLIREAGDKITATYDEENFYVMSSVYNGILIDQKFKLKYILALLNSNVFQFLMDLIVFKRTAGAFTKAKIYHYYELPVKNISVDRQNEIIHLVDKILIEKKKDSKSDTSQIEKEIDELVMDLYELTDEEKKIIYG